MSLDRDRDPLDPLDNIRSFPQDIVGGGGTGGTDIMGFEIVFATPSEGTAFVTPIFRPRPGPVVEESNELEYLVKVHDVLGCFLNETGGALLGRRGVAARVFVDSFSQCELESEYDPTPGFRWEVIQLCCRENSCPEILG